MHSAGSLISYCYVTFDWRYTAIYLVLNDTYFYNKIQDINGNGVWSGWGFGSSMYYFTISVLKSISLYRNTYIHCLRKKN